MTKRKQTPADADTQPPAGDLGLRGDALLIALLAAGYSQGQAAQSAGVSSRTVSRRMDDPAFVAQVQQAQATTIQQVAARLTVASLRAVSTLLRLLDGRSETVRLGAAKAVLELAVRYRESQELEARLAQLEDLKQRLEALEQPRGRGARWAR